MPILIKLANISRLEPLIISKSLLGLGFVLEVPFEDGIASDPNLALRGLVRRVVSCIGKVDELDFDGRGDVTESSVGPMHWIGQSAHAGCFGQTVTGDHGSDSQGDEALGILGDGAAAVHTQPETSARSVFNLLEDNGVQDRCTRQASRHKEAFCGKCPPEEILHERTARVNFGHDTFLH